jgi:hypothetical protein
MLTALLSACGNDKDIDLLEKNDYDRSREETETIAEPEEPDVSDTPTPAAAEESGESLAKRLCGKYSYHLGGDDGTEYLIMNIVSFGDKNLCGVFRAFSASAVNRNDILLRQNCQGSVSEVARQHIDIYCSVYVSFDEFAYLPHVNNRYVVFSDCLLKTVWFH